MGRVIITGVDGNFGSHAAKTVLDKIDKKDLIFTSPNREALKKYKDRGVDASHADYKDSEHLADAFRGGDTLLLISAPQVGEKRRNREEQQKVIPFT